LVPYSQQPEDLLARLAIRELIDNWAIWRDARMWAKIEQLWHAGGVMMTTWGGTSTPAEFAKAAQTGYERGDRMLHSNGGTTVDIVGNRAIAQTKLRIMQRVSIGDVECDVVCIGRDYDFVERRNGRWGFILRQPIYERDLITTVDPNAKLSISAEALKRYPEGYGRLGYLQETLGYKIVGDMPAHDGPRLMELYQSGERWLAGGPLTWAIAS
jgi:hypothetical protein